MDLWATKTRKTPNMTTTTTTTTTSTMSARQHERRPSKSARRHRPLPCVFTAAALVLSACVTTLDTPHAPLPTPAPVNDRAPLPTPVFSSHPVDVRFSLLHFSDSESAILSKASEHGVDAEAGGIAWFSSLIDGLVASSTDPALVVAAGDTFLPAPELKIEFEGKNAVLEATHLTGIRATAIGNHEFDLGESFLADVVAKSRFPYLSSTIDIAGGPLDALDFEPQDLTPTPFVDDVGGRILPRAKACLGAALVRDDAGGARCPGTVVGLVGATTDTLRQISSLPDHIHVVDGPTAVRDAIQVHVDALTAEGVHIVVLISHLQGVRKELQLIEDGLHGVDVIIAGGGDNRLADPGTRLLPGHEPDDVCRHLPVGQSCYPLVRKATDGAPVVVVATDGQLQYVGHLAVGFDAQGRLTDVDGARSRPWPVDEASLVELRVAPEPMALQFESRVRDTLAPLRRRIVDVDVFLDGTRESVRNHESNLGSLSADAMLDAARRRNQSADFALRNAGGIRAAIGSTDVKTSERRGTTIRQIDVEAAFRFDNALVLTTTTHQAIRETLESALREAGTSRGHFPQVSAGVRLEYLAGSDQLHDVSDGKITQVSCLGGRVFQLSVNTPNGKITIVKDGVVLTPDATMTFVTVDYLAKGGDGYFPASSPTTTPLVDDQRKPVTEQRAIVELLLDQEARGVWQRGQQYPANPDPAQRRLIFRSDLPTVTRDCHAR